MELFLNNKNKKKIYFILLLVFSIAFNQYYGHVGVFPLDSFIIFNSGYDFLNGYYPFKDYWTITGPLLDLLQAIFFKIFGVSWFSYVLHASIFNSIIVLSTFYTLEKFELNLDSCFLYSLLVASLTYPIVGTPFMDHHSAILSMVGLFIFVLALKTKLNFFWFIMPLILGLAFLSKQTPSIYFIIIIMILTIIYFTFNFDIKKIFLFILGNIIFLILFFLFLKIGEVSFASFFEQYILFPQSIGKDRIDFLFPLEFKRLVLRFKLIYISIAVLVIVIVRKTINNYKYILGEEFFIIASLIGVSFSLIIHQLMTINAKFIFFIIPIMIAFSHIFYKKYFKQKNYILYFFIIFSLISTLYYQYNYNSNRRFMDLKEVDLKKAIDAKAIDQKLSKLKWISILYPDNPKKEILNIIEAMKLIEKDSRTKTVVTDYQFISVLSSSYDYSPNRFWHRGVGYPTKQNKFFKIYKNFFINSLKKNEIKIAYIVKPLYFEKNVFDQILSEDCYKKNEITDILDSYVLLECKELL